MFFGRILRDFDSICRSRFLMTDPFLLHQDFILNQTERILSSYRHWVNKDLLPLSGDALLDARNVFQGPLVILSADTNNILNYGNQAALQLWQMDWPTFVHTPSQQTAEPEQRQARQALLQQVREKGYMDNYEGIRISSQGARFRIQGATVWNLLDRDGTYAGQAAAFSSWQNQ
jgi:hypothetical protein